MVRLTGAVALVLAASANAAATFKPNVIPGAYIFELDDAEVGCRPISPRPEEDPRCYVAE